MSTKSLSALIKTKQNSGSSLARRIRQCARHVYVIAQSNNCQLFDYYLMSCSEYYIHLKDDISHLIRTWNQLNLANEC